MSVLRAGNLGLAFLLELGMLAALAVWGASRTAGLPVRLALAVGAPVLIAAVWGVLLAPASGHRLGMPWLVVGQVLLLGLGVAALAAAGHRAWAAVFAALVVLNQALALAWHQQ